MQQHIINDPYETVENLKVVLNSDIARNIVDNIPIQPPNSTSMLVNRLKKYIKIQDRDRRSRRGKTKVSEHVNKIRCRKKSVF